MPSESMWHHREKGKEAFLAWARKWHTSDLSEPILDEVQPQEKAAKGGIRYYHAETGDGVKYRISEQIRLGWWGFVSQDTSDAYWNRMGRPSQGRTARVQSAVTPELMQRIAAEKQGSETMSDVVFRLLEKAVSK